MGLRFSPPTREAILEQSFFAAPTNESMESLLNAKKNECRGKRGRLPLVLIKPASKFQIHDTRDVTRSSCSPLCTAVEQAAMVGTPSNRLPLLTGSHSPLALFFCTGQRTARCTGCPSGSTLSAQPVTQLSARSGISAAVVRLLPDILSRQSLSRAIMQ